MTQEPTENESEFGPQPEDIIECDGDKEKFIRLANVGLPAVVYLRILAGVFSYEVTDEFVLIKKAMKIPWDASDKPLLQGKSMFCRYQRGKFDPRLIETLDFDLQNFKGSLKNTIEGFMRSQAHRR